MPANPVPSSGLPPLPYGYQVFENLREMGAIYVDKTAYLPELPGQGQVVFCARPRRFGKSLTISAMEAFFTGRKDLFAGLAVEPFMNTPAFTPRPVIRLDMSAIAGSASRENLEDGILQLLKENSERYGVTFRETDPGIAFRILLRDLSRAE